ncbi:MAG: hypothetical protein C0476_09105 [Sphingomonas sp.]|nr:hypothetical protein [Sphingomonas sp.]
MPAIITSDDNNNAIIVFGTPRVYALIEAALRQLDVPPVQVLIEAAITEVGLTDDLRYGVQWNFTSGNTNTVLTESTTATDVAQQVPGFSFLFARTGLNAVLNTLATKTKINVVSAPKLLVLNNQTAVLQVGDQVPVLTQSSTSTVAGNAPVINAIEYRDTGVILKVTPRVNASGGSVARHFAGSQRRQSPAHRRVGCRLADDLHTQDQHIGRGEGQRGAGAWRVDP